MAGNSNSLTAKDIRRAHKILSKAAAKAPKWLSIIWKGRMAEIDNKGRIRPVRRNSQ